MQSCIFCKIVAGEIPAEKIQEDDSFLVFLDVKPITPGHTLVIPKKHAEYLFDLEQEEYSSLLEKSKGVARHLKERLGSEKIGMVVEGFGVPHVHIHLVPINGPQELNPALAKSASPEELKEMAAKMNS